MSSVLGWHREDIKAALRKRFGSLRNAECVLGLSEGTITASLRKALSQPTELVVAEALGIEAHILWPDRWVKSGNYMIRRPANSTAKSGLRRENRKAA